MPISIETNVEELNRTLLEYARLSGKTVQEAVKKQASKLAFNLRQQLRGVAPAKGAIRAQLLARLASKQGVRVRPSILAKVYQSQGARSMLSTGQVVFGRKGKTTARRGGKRVNLRALAVRAEIAARESARGFLGVSATYAGIGGNLVEARATSRFGPVLSIAAFKALAEDAGGSVEFKWSPNTSKLSAEAAEGINRKGESAVNRALVGTLEDIQIYIDRKLTEHW